MIVGPNKGRQLRGGNVWGAVLAAVVLAAAGAAYVVISGADNPRGATTRTAEEAFAPRAAAISRELLSGNAAALRDAIAMPAGIQVAPAGAQSLAALKALTFETATFQERSPSTAVVRAVVTDGSGAQRAWTVALVRVAGEWKLAQSTPAPS